MNNEILFLVQSSPEGGYEARSLGYSIYTEADTLEELREMIREAVHCHFGDAECPGIIPLHNNLRVGTLNNILSDVALHLNIPKQELLKLL